MKWALPAQETALKSLLNRLEDTRKTVKRVKEHFYRLSVHIRDIA